MRMPARLVIGEKAVICAIGEIRGGSTWIMKLRMTSVGVERHNLLASVAWPR